MKKIITIIVVLAIIISFLIIIKLSKVNNTFVTETTNSIESGTVEEEEKKVLKGSYEWEPGYPTTACVFYFSPDGKVIWYSDAYSTGTYKIDDNQVILSIEETIGPDNYIVPDAVKQLTLNIVDESTLSDTSGTLFHKTSDENVVLLKQQREMEQVEE